MLFKLKALFYAAFHSEIIRLTVVRRYVDAQKNYIGELYMGSDREAKMIGMSCDNLPFNVERAVGAKLCWGKDFLAVMAPNTLRVGAQEPKDNESVRRIIAVRQYCDFEINVRNRFIEYVLDGKSYV